MMDDQYKYIYMSDESVCSKHGKTVSYVCAMENCGVRKMCDDCKTKDSIHFSQHANFIYRLKDFHDYSTSKELIPRLEKSLQDSQNFVNSHKNFYLEQIRRLNLDFEQLTQIFKEVNSNYRKIYTEAFEKELNKFDSELMSIKSMLKEYARQRVEEESFFSRIFGGDQKDKNKIEDIVKKHGKVFKVRASIISIRSQIAMAKSNQTAYKSTTQEQHRFDDLKENFKQFSMGFYDKLKQLLSNQGSASSLKSSIVSEAKSLSSSQVSLGVNLATSQVSPGIGNPPALSGRSNSASERCTSQKELHSSRARVSLPEPHPSVLKIIKLLKPMEYPPKLPMIVKAQGKKQEGPFRYPLGVYLGTYEEGVRSGCGIFIFAKDGSYYQGTWEQDNMWGYGRLITENSYYEGQIANGAAHGAGTYENSQKVYSGQWSNDQRHGKGEETYKNRRHRYRGEFFHDRYHGKGTLQDEDYVYSGNFKEGLFDGQGNIRWKNGETFVGVFRSGQKMHGRHTLQDGSWYQGQYEGGVPGGRGEFRWSDGVRYVGMWRGGVQEGEGIQVLDGRQNRGLWKGGRWVKWL